MNQIGREEIFAILARHPESCKAVRRYVGFLALQRQIVFMAKLERKLKAESGNSSSGRSGPLNAFFAGMVDKLISSEKRDEHANNPLARSPSGRRLLAKLGGSQAKLVVQLFTPAVEQLTAKSSEDWDQLRQAPRRANGAPSSSFTKSGPRPRRRQRALRTAIATSTTPSTTTAADDHAPVPDCKPGMPLRQLPRHRSRERGTTKLIDELQQELRESMRCVHEMHVQGCNQLARIESVLGIQHDGAQKHATFCVATETSNDSSTRDADLMA